MMWVLIGLAACYVAVLNLYCAQPRRFSLQQLPAGIPAPESSHQVVSWLLTYRWWVVWGSLLPFIWQFGLEVGAVWWLVSLSLAGFVVLFGMVLKPQHSLWTGYMAVFVVAVGVPLTLFVQALLAFQAMYVDLG